MRYLITLRLDSSEATLAHARELLDAFGLTVDVDYGLVNISPSRGLYVVRIEDGVDIERLTALPEVVGVHGDINIAPITQTQDHDGEE